MATPKRAASNKKEETRKKMTQKKKLASPLCQRTWSEEDELSLLKKLVDFRSNKTKMGAKIDWDAFYSFLRCKFSMDQMLSKVNMLKQKYLEDKKRIDGGNDPLFTRCSDSAMFGYAIMLWGQDDGSDIVTEETSKEDNVQVLNAETVNDNEADKSNVDEELAPKVAVDKVEENKTVGEDSHDDDDADVLCHVRDAFESTMSLYLSDYQKKLQLQKLMNLGAGKRKQLSKEWNELCAEETKLNIKKIKFSVKLAEASTY